MNSLPLNFTICKYTYVRYLLLCLKLDEYDIKEEILFLFYNGFFKMKKTTSIESIQQEDYLIN